MKYIKQLAITLTAVLMALTLTYCTKPIAGQATGDYDAGDVGKVNKVLQGTIISGRVVNVYNKPEGQAIQNTSNELNADVTRRTGYEYVIKLDTGAIVSVVQTENLHLKPKQHILVIYGASTRVVADEGSTE